MVGNFCMDLAIAKAKETGIGWVCARGGFFFSTSGPVSLVSRPTSFFNFFFFNFCMDLAIAKAKETGIGWVCARGRFFFLQLMAHFFSTYCI